MFTEQDKVYFAKRRDEKLLDIYILLEDNTYASTVKAVKQYQDLTGITSYQVAATELRAKYKLFIDGDK